MKDAELADDIERGHVLIIASAPFQSVPLGAKDQIIAALRRGLTPLKRHDYTMLAEHLCSIRDTQSELIACVRGNLDLITNTLKWADQDQPSSDQVLVPKKVLDAAWALSAFIRHNEYPIVGSMAFNEFVRLADMQDTALRMMLSAAEAEGRKT